MFRKYDPKGTGKLDVHSFVLRLISPAAEPEPWFRDRDTYEFHVLNRAPMKKVRSAICVLVCVFNVCVCFFCVCAYRCPLDVTDCADRLTKEGFQ